ncbi:MAG: alpha/beta hydrolase [Gammaproteobacteria bacterium]|nr:alpha/beta hydrolase [Gammaproteobacteria bacterium]
MPTYFAPKPTHLQGDMTRAVLVRVFFPPIIFWDLTKAIVRNVYGMSFGQKIMLSQSENFSEASIPENNNLLNIIFDRSFVITHDNAKLDTLTISAKNAVNPKNRQLHIINFVGIGMSYHDIFQDMKEDCLALKCTVIGFNYRGIHTSSGKLYSKDDLIVDGIAQVQRLLDDEVIDQNIILAGHSLGGAIATLVTKHFHDRGYKIKLFNSRSLSSLADFFASYKMNPYPSNWLERVKNSYIRFMVHFKFNITNWQIDAAEAFKSIPESYKEYIVVRSPKELRFREKNCHIDDPVIFHEVSLHAALKALRKQKKLEIREKCNNPEELADKLAEFKKRKFHTEFYASNGHSLPLKALICNYDNKTTALNFFHMFARRSQDLHQENADNTSLCVNKNYKAH